MRFPFIMLNDQRSVRVRRKLNFWISISEGFSNQWSEVAKTFLRFPRLIPLNGAKLGADVGRCLAPSRQNAHFKVPVHPGLSTIAPSGHKSPRSELFKCPIWRHRLEAYAFQGNDSEPCCEAFRLSGRNSLARSSDFLQLFFRLRWGAQIFNHIFIRSHLGLADEGSTFLYHQAGRFQVPDQLGM